MQELSTDWMYLLAAGILGLCMGSFITMASYRLPRDEDTVFIPSHCTSCHATLGFWDLFPVLSWLFRLGKCRHCGVSVSVRYPLIEIVTAALFVWLFMRYGLSLETLILMGIASALVLLIVTDFEHLIIPDEVQIALFILVASYHVYHATDLTFVLQGLGVGLFTGLGLHYGYRWVRKKEGLGWGDVKLLPTIGLAVGAKPFVLVLILSGLLGILTGLLWRVLKKGPQFPFGPALVIAMFLILVFASELSMQPWLKDFFTY